MAVFLEVLAVRQAVEFVEAGQVHALESARATALLIGVAGGQAAVSMTVEVEVGHHVAGPVRGTV